MLLCAEYESARDLARLPAERFSRFLAFCRDDASTFAQRRAPRRSTRTLRVPNVLAGCPAPRLLSGVQLFSCHLPLDKQRRDKP